MTILQADIVIIGAGVMGITLALELKKRFPDQKIIILEKELQAGLHASGRNSGVLHAGFYYTADSLKAKFCRDGNRAMKLYCQSRHLKINHNGKLVITKNESELNGLKILYERGIKNGVNLKLVTEQEAREIESRVRTVKQAIFSPDTASVDPIEVIKSLVKDAEGQHIKFLYQEKFLKYNSKEKIIITNKRKIKIGFVINAAGLYADKIAKQFGFSLHYEIVPFKGLYLYSNEKPGAIKTHIYPVPDLNYPFLGIHLTVTVDGKIKMGPTAIPTFWREQYNGLNQFSLSEMFHIVKRETILFAKNKFHFREVAIHELKKYSKKFLSSEATHMIDDMRTENYTTWGKPGIRAQLINKKDNTLVIDFCYEGDDHSFHILNAVSPAFTSSFPFSKFLIDKIF